MSSLASITARDMAAVGGAHSAAPPLPPPAGGLQWGALSDTSLSPPPLRTSFTATMTEFSASSATLSPEAPGSEAASPAQVLPAAAQGGSVKSPDSDSVYSEAFDDAAASPSLSEMSPLGPSATVALGAAAGGNGAAGSAAKVGQPAFEVAEEDIEEDIGGSYGGSNDSGGLGAF